MQLRSAVVPLLSVMVLGACMPGVATTTLEPLQPIEDECPDALEATASVSFIEETSVPAPVEESIAPPPPLAREFRGVWVASVSNIDWPSRRGLTGEQQRDELIRILDTAKRAGLNAIIFQVRPAGDALYTSALEPWSEYLSGEQGRSPGYDPLAFVIDEAHRRGLELHAWFNPYRARHSSARSQNHAQHISRRRPDLVRRYGPYLWMDPGEPEVREHTLRVIQDVVQRYDVDGVHIDDYFYPYRERDAKGRLIEFPDQPSWQRYVAAGGKLTREDWRRQNVNQFVEQLYHTVKTEKPWVKVGISPFGIWRPGHPAVVRGLDAFVELYADSRTWLANGWLDYLAPQLYWRTAAPAQPYRELLGWWIDQNIAGRHIWPGNIPNRVGSGAQDFTHHEVPGQIRLTRAAPGAGGNVLFSMRSLLANRGGIVDTLRTSIFDSPALVPASPWLHAPAPSTPTLRLEHDHAERTTTLVLETAGQPPFLWIVRMYTRDGWSATTADGRSERLLLRWQSEEPLAIAVSALARNGVEGPADLAPVARNGRGCYPCDSNSNR